MRGAAIILAMVEGRFVTVIACIDGRVQAPLATWAKETFGADWADMVTRPGCDGVLGDEDAGARSQIRQDVEVSVRAHDPVAVVVSGHNDCAANPGPQSHHEPQIQAAVGRVGRWGLGVPAVGVWVGEDWKVHPVTDVEPPSSGR